MQNPISAITGQPVEKLIENRSAFTFKHSELCLYETFQTCERERLRFRNPVLLSMISGKKVMHFGPDASFEFMPGETLVIAPHRSMEIDFPEASVDNPTRCLTLEIGGEKIEEALNLIGGQPSANSPGQGNYYTAGGQVYVMRDKSVSDIIKRLVGLNVKDNPARRVLFDLGLKELIVRLLHTDASRTLLAAPDQSSQRLFCVMDYIQRNLHRNVSIDELCEHACMSKPSLFRHFRNQHGVSPTDFINRERIELAKRKLRSTAKSVTDVCYEIGYNHPSYFVRLFKKYEGITPKQFQKTSC